ncbi:hypothetical protein R69746_06969 [Paraburkholderia aspalathi]|nr:hypothetical protein R69746_06969 [Paraburkholderia aspalathi]
MCDVSNKECDSIEAGGRTFSQNRTDQGSGEVLAESGMPVSWRAGMIKDLEDATVCLEQLLELGVKAEALLGKVRTTLGHVQQLRIEDRAGSSAEHSG